MKLYSSCLDARERVQPVAGFASCYWHPGMFNPGRPDYSTERARIIGDEIAASGCALAELDFEDYEKAGVGPDELTAIVKVVHQQTDIPLSCYGVRIPLLDDLGTREWSILAARELADKQDAKYDARVKYAADCVAKWGEFAHAITDGGGYLGIDVYPTGPGYEQRDLIDYPRTMLPLFRSAFGCRVCANALGSYDPYFNGGKYGRLTFGWIWDLLASLKYGDAVNLWGPRSINDRLIQSFWKNKAENKAEYAA